MVILSLLRSMLFFLSGTICFLCIAFLLRNIEVMRRKRIAAYRVWVIRYGITKIMRLILQIMNDGYFISNLEKSENIFIYA